MSNNQLYTVTTKDGQSHIVEFRWGISRGRDTYGYNTVSCYVDGDKVGHCNGGGYDMQGASIQGWVKNWAVEHNLFKLEDKLEQLPYGFHVYEEGKLSVDGACGFNTILQGIDATYRCLKY